MLSRKRRGISGGLNLRRPLVQQLQYALERFLLLNHYFFFQKQLNNRKLFKMRQSSDRFRCLL
jgi:hypothetical protein